MQLWSRTWTRWRSGCHWAGRPCDSYGDGRTFRVGTGSKRTVHSRPLGSVSPQAPHQSGSLGWSGGSGGSGAVVIPKLSASPRRANAQPSDAREAVFPESAPGSPASPAKAGQAVCKWTQRLIRAGSATRGGLQSTVSGPDLRPGRTQPWPIAKPSESVTVTQIVVCGLITARAARDRHSSGSSGPSPWPLPGR